MLAASASSSCNNRGSQEGARRAPVLLPFVSVIVGLALVVAVLAMTACRQFQPHTSDTELAEFYRKNREAMTRFAQLSIANPEIAHMWTGQLDLKDGRQFKSSEYSEPGWIELDRLMSQLPLVRGTLVCKDRVFMYNLCRGMSPGSCKGYVFSRKIPTSVVDSLDHDPPRRLDDYKRAYKRIDDNWYIVYEVFRGARNSDTGCLGTFDAPISNKYEWSGAQP